MASFEITCANCGHPEFRMTAPTELSAAELLELAQQKLREEAEQKATDGVRYNPPAPLPDAPSMQEASGVKEVVETVEQADRLQGTGWNVAKWSTPNKWIAWESKVPSAKCESCGGPIELGEECRWLMQSRAPGGTGLTMHVDCWLSEQEHSQVDWERILRDAGIPEPPGRPELVARLRAEREERVAQGGEAAAKPKKRRQTKRKRSQ